MTTPATPHTPTPWMREDRTVYALNVDGVNRMFTNCQGGFVVGRERTTEQELEANAALIVHCVNTHAQLVAALEGMLAEWDKFTRYGSPMAKAANERVAAARAAISAGKGGVG